MRIQTFCARPWDELGMSLMVVGRLTMVVTITASWAKPSSVLRRERFGSIGIMSLCILSINHYSSLIQQTPHHLVILVGSAKYNSLLVQSTSSQLAQPTRSLAQKHQASEDSLKLNTRSASTTGRRWRNSTSTTCCTTLIPRQSSTSSGASEAIGTWLKQ